MAGATAALKALHGKSLGGSALSVRYKRRLRKKRPLVDGSEALSRAQFVEGAGEDEDDEDEDEEEDDEDDEDEEAGEAVVMTGGDLEEGGATKATIAASNVRRLVTKTEAASATELSQQGKAKHGAGHRAEEDEEGNHEDSDWEEPVMAGAVAGAIPSRPRQLIPSAVPSATPAATWTGEPAAAFTESSFTESALTESSFTRSIRSFAAAGMLGRKVPPTNPTAAGELGSAAATSSSRTDGDPFPLHSPTGLHTSLAASLSLRRGGREGCEDGADGKLDDLQALARSYNELASSELARWGG